MSKKQFLLENQREGEVDAGLILSHDTTEPDYHLFLLPGEQLDVQWQAAIDWAKGIGGDLPTRREQSLLIANCKHEFKSTWYWSNTSYERDSSCAWVQGFYGGSQGTSPKYDGNHARAVRRLPIVEIV